MIHIESTGPSYEFNKYIDTCFNLAYFLCDLEGLTLQEAKNWALKIAEARKSLVDAKQRVYVTLEGITYSVLEGLVWEVAINSARKEKWGSLSYHLDILGKRLSHELKSDIGVAICSISEIIRNQV